MYNFEKIIVYFKYPSFGDYLMISHLPELFYNKYNLYTYISSSCIFYDFDTYKLLFEHNPFVVGITDETPNLIIDGQDKIEFNTYYPNFYSKKFGLPEKNITPKVYYVPKQLNEYNNIILFDIASRNYKNKYFKKIEKQVYVLCNNLLSLNTNLELGVLKFKDNSSGIERFIPKTLKYTEIFVENLFNVCDILNSIKYYIGINSGSALLASSIKEHYNNNLEIFYFTPELGRLDWGSWNPPNVNLRYFKHD